MNSNICDQVKCPFRLMLLSDYGLSVANTGKSKKCVYNEGIEARCRQRCYFCSNPEGINQCWTLPKMMENEFIYFVKRKAIEKELQNVGENL